MEYSLKGNSDEQKRSSGIFEKLYLKIFGASPIRNPGYATVILSRIIVISLLELMSCHYDGTRAVIIND